MAQTVLNIPIDEKLKQQFDEFCDDVGITSAAALTVFVKKVVNEWRIPFSIGEEIEVPNAETIAAMGEADEIAEKGDYRFTSVDDMFKELGI